MAIPNRRAPFSHSEADHRPLRWVVAIALAVAALTHLPASALRLVALGRTDRDALLDGFERDPWPDPGLWRVADDAGWRPTTCRARSGARALRAFTGPRGSAEPACDASVAPGAVSTAVMVLDLRAATDANRLDLSWEMWPRLNPADDSGLALFLRVPRPGGGVDRVPVFGATALADGWVYPVRQLDLRNLTDVRDPRQVFDLRGGRWEIEWVAAAPAGAPPGGGLAIDDVRLIWEPDLAVPSPTQRPFHTATPTPTPTEPTATLEATREPTPTRAATPTATAAGLRIFLPVARNDPPPEATPTATSTEAGGTPSATGEPSAMPSASATDVPPSPTPPAARCYLPAVAASEPPVGAAYPAPTEVR